MRNRLRRRDDGPCGIENREPAFSACREAVRDAEGKMTGLKWAEPLGVEATTGGTPGKLICSGMGIDGLVSQIRELCLGLKKVDPLRA